jgi:hypothetical protein
MRIDPCETPGALGYAEAVGQTLDPDALALWAHQVIGARLGAVLEVAGFDADDGAVLIKIVCPMARMVDEHRGQIDHLGIIMTLWWEPLWRETIYHAGNSLWRSFQDHGGTPANRLAILNEHHGSLSFRALAADGAWSSTG